MHFGVHGVQKAWPWLEQGPFDRLCLRQVVVWGVQSDKIQSTDVTSHWDIKRCSKLIIQPRQWAERQSRGTKRQISVVSYHRIPTQVFRGPLSACRVFSQKRVRHGHEHRMYSDVWDPLPGVKSRKRRRVCSRKGDGLVLPNR